MLGETTDADADAKLQTPKLNPKPQTVLHLEDQILNHLPGGR